MQHVASKFVPRLLSVDQKQRRLDVCLDLKENSANDPSFLLTVITGDETWVYAYDLETKTQSSKWKSPGLPRAKKARQVRSNIKSMLICFFDQKGIIHKEFVPPGQTVNAAFYVEVLKRLQENVRRKWPDQWWDNTWLLHHDNAPAHTALLPYSFWPIATWLWCHILPTRPILHPATFSYFQKWKWSLRGEDFRRWRKFKQNRRPSWTRCEKMTSRNTSKSGSTAGIVVKPQKEIILKVMPAPNV